MKKLVGMILFLGFFAFYLQNVAPSVTTGDSGEFMTVASTLSLAHAPSYPLYALTGKSFITLIPFGSVPYRCNAFSAFTSALTLVIFFLMASSMGGGMAISVFVPLLIGLSASFWENSLVTEVFSLNTLFVALLFLCLQKREFLLFSFLLGLGVGNHQILIFLIPGFLLLAAFNRFPLKQWILFFLLGTIGISVYLTLPIRSVKEPPLNWGKPVTIVKLVRTITRKDYGTLKLALGESPDRNFKNMTLHIRTFVRHLKSEVPWPLWILVCMGAVWGLWKKDRTAYWLLAIFISTGPFFFWLGNLPFNAQSDGIVGRFLIIPAVSALLLLVVLFRERQRLGMIVLAVFIILTFQKNIAVASVHRSTTMVLDYGRSMLRTMPPNSILFMDGGDDAFYSLAMLHYVMGKRADVELYDRGGLVFKNPYGDDFRSIPKELKPARRAQVEKAALTRGEVFYSTMDNAVLPGFKVVQSGFLMKVNTVPRQSDDWALIVLRSLYPLEPNVYRMRALGAFFPFMRGRQLLERGSVDDALFWFRRAQSMGGDVDWLRNNLSVEYARLGYDKLISHDFSMSERIYRQWIAFDPTNIQAQSNFGVVLERTGRIEEAKAQYELTAKMFPTAADPVFNLSVLAWKAGRWPEVISYLEEVLRRNPNHAQAQGYLSSAREKLRRS